MILVFDNLPLTIIVSENKRARYYGKDDKISERMLSKIGTIYRWSDDGFLYDASTGKFVIKRGDIGPNVQNINGSAFWDLPAKGPKGAKHAKVLASIKTTVKSKVMHWFIDELAKMEKPVVTGYPITVEFIFNITKTPVKDVDNFKLFYEKAFLDAIQTTIFVGQGVTAHNPVGFIPNDDKRHIRRLETELNEGCSKNTLIVVIKEFKNVKFVKGEHKVIKKP